MRIINLSLNPGADGIVKKSLRILIVKPLVEPHLTGTVLRHVMSQYKVDLKQVMVVVGDSQVLAGTIAISHEADTTKSHSDTALQSIFDSIGDDFLRFRFGVGLASGNQSLESHMNEAIKPSHEMDTFGYTLDITGQAIQNYMTFQGKKHFMV